jgi:predicted component of type VI protein secretion system
VTDRLVLIRADGDAATRHMLRPHMLIGRSRGSDLRLRERGVQRRHAVIEHFSSGLAIRSLSSRAEVLVNDQRVLRRTIIPGDRISIGPAVFSVEEREPETVWERDGHGGAAHAQPSSAVIPEDPVPPQVLARVRKPETAPTRFSGPPMPRRRSVATHRSATFICLAVVVADAIALEFYLKVI